MMVSVEMRLKLIQQISSDTRSLIEISGGCKYLIYVEHQTSASAKSSNFKHPYYVDQKFPTYPCGASVAISYSCTDNESVLKKN